MTSQITSQSGTLLDALAAALRQAAVCNRQDMVAPAAVLWTDKENHWRNLIPLLRKLGLPVFSLGDYDPATGSDPAIWLRCAIAGTLPEIKVPAEATPVLYLPGFSRQECETFTGDSVRHTFSWNGRTEIPAGPAERAVYPEPERERFRKIRFYGWLSPSKKKTVLPAIRAALGKARSLGVGGLARAAARRRRRV